MDEAARLALSRELVDKILDLGYPMDFAQTIARELYTERALKRMLGYLRLAHPRSAEDIADELFAILEDKQRWIDKKKSEEANARYNMYLNRPRDDDE